MFWHVRCHPCTLHPSITAVWIHKDITGCLLLINGSDAWKGVQRWRGWKSGVFLEAHSQNLPKTPHMLPYLHRPKQVKPQWSLLLPFVTKKRTRNGKKMKDEWQREAADTWAVKLQDTFLRGVLICQNWVTPSLPLIYRTWHVLDGQMEPMRDTVVPLPASKWSCSDGNAVTRR